MSDIEKRFDSTFDKFKEIKDKFESLYIFVIYETLREELEDIFSKLIKNIDSISDSKKKHYIKSRITNFKNTIDSTKDTIINGIYLVGETVKYVPIEKYYIDTLKMFKIGKCNYKFDNYYPIGWLKNFVIERSYVNVVKVKNNDVSITKFNQTKQLTVYNETIKSFNLIEFLKTRMEKDIKFLVHGSIKQINDYKNNLCLGIENKELKIEEIHEYIEDSFYKENIKELENWLSKIVDPKENHKIVYNNDILEQGENGFLETIYCTFENKIKFNTLENIHIKVVKSSKNNEIINNFHKNFNGVLGIKYY
jgi:hypothetical protein